MAETVICPVCGESNAADMEFCRNCQSRLLPVPGALSSENTAIQPGELPTKKTTSELEPLLPQWLRDARQKARETAGDSNVEFESEPPSSAPSQPPDLLAGLQSQASDEDEDIPDWLASITGATNKKKKPLPEDNQVKWVELGRREEEDRGLTPLDAESMGPTSSPAAKTPEQDLTDWLRQAGASNEVADFQPSPAPNEDFYSNSSLFGSAPEPTSEPSTEDLSWLRNLDAAASVPAEEPPSEIPATGADLPDWLQKLQAEQMPPPAPEPREQASSLYSADVPDWLKRFGEESPVSAATEPAAQDATTPAQAVPDWLKSAAATATVHPDAKEPEPLAHEPAEPGEMPDWISSLGQASSAVQPAEPAPFAPQEPIHPGDLPDWVSELSKPADAAPAPGEELLAGGLPDWLKSLDQPGDRTGAVEAGNLALASELEQPESTPEEAIVPAELPDWISGLGKAAVASAALSADAEARPASAEAAGPTEEPELPPAMPADEDSSARLFGEAKPIFAPEPPATETPVAPLTAAAAFAAQEPASDDVDAIFASMQSPDWLSGVALGAAASQEKVPAAAEPEEPIAPAELPSWVQAMRPVESAVVLAAAADKEISTEPLGPLAGLHGVLPAIPGAAQATSKPKPHSIKLVATEQQQAHAVLLEQILAAETSPVPMRSSVVLRSERVLRWVLSVLIMVLLAATVYSGSQIFALPSAVPNETMGAIQAVESIPADAPVLLVFDYQPATAAEMEASGASLIDHLVVMKHPRLALVSTSATGSALAERFMSQVLVDNEGRPKYARGVQYVDLGYLAGGLAGVYSFAHNPRVTMPLDAGSRPAWNSAVIGPVQDVSDFSGIIVLTDSLESGRTWVEQTQSTRDTSPLVLISSAQAGPMLMPYVDSGQVQGMVSGVYGAAAVEQGNAGSPAIHNSTNPLLPSNAGQVGYVRRYWDAYNVGLYLAVALTVLGGLWNLWLGIRDRRAQAVG